MIIGLTGGIASGKSTAAAFFADQGAWVIDADKLGHRAYDPGTSAFDQVVATFGADVVAADGTIDRRVLGAKVFGEGNRLQELTNIVWPAIRAMAETEIQDALAQDPHRPVFLEAAVLLEAGWQDLVDQVWVTAVDRAVAIERATARDNLSAEAVAERIDAQLSNDERISAAHHVIWNNADPAAFNENLQAAWAKISS